MNKKIKKALDAGVERKSGRRASADQELVFICAARKPFYHADYESANEERLFLEKALGHKVRVLKVLSVKSDDRRLKAFNKKNEEVA